MLSFRHKKQNSKTVADTTFKVYVMAKDILAEVAFKVKSLIYLKVHFVWIFTFWLVSEYFHLAGAIQEINIFQPSVALRIENKMCKSNDWFLYEMQHWADKD